MSERRIGETTVILTRDGDHGTERLVGQQYVTYPVDEPALVEIPQLRVRLCAYVWMERGWTIEDAA